MSTGDRHCSSESEQSIQVEGRNFGIVSLKVREVKVIWQGFLNFKQTNSKYTRQTDGAALTNLSPREPHRLEQGLTAILEIDDQFELGAPLLLCNGFNGCEGHLPEDLLNHLVGFGTVTVYGIFIDA
jgi:hypothetical protein